MNQTLSDKAAQALEWPRLLDCLAQGAQSTLGAARCRALAVENELDVLVRRQQETTEWLRLGEGSDPAPALSFPDVRELVERAHKGGVLEAVELRDCGLVLALMEEAARFVARHQGDAAVVSGEDFKHQAGFAPGIAVQDERGFAADAGGLA